MKYLIQLLLLLLLNNSMASAADNRVAVELSRNNKRINFFISSRTRKINPAMQSAQVLAHLNSMFHKKFIFLIVDSAGDLERKILPILKRQDSKIGSIWFDSHGHFSRRYSSFEMGSTEISYAKIKDGSAINALFVPC